MKEKDLWADEWIAKERGVISTRDAWLAGFECAKQKICEQVFITFPGPRFLGEKEIGLQNSENDGICEQEPS